MPVDESLRQTLIAMRDADRAKRDELLRRGDLFEGYHPEMERVHADNAAHLAELLDRHGWPGTALAGEDGAEAAWLVAMHGIGLPFFQRRCRLLLQRAVERGEAPPSHVAYLGDRIRFNERRPQLYGTQLDWDERDELSPWPIEAPESVDARRTQVGLPPLADAVRDARAGAAAEGARPPKPYGERQAEIRAWAHRVGWMDT
jgi:Family of unknown function (DUF6624)